MIDYTVTPLVADVRTTASVPTVQPRFGVDGILKIMTRIMQTKIVPMMMTAQEDYFIDYEDFDIEQGNVTGYAIPNDAVGMKVHNVCLLNNSSVLNMTTLPRLSINRISGYYFGQVVPFGFYIQNNNVILWPPNQTSPARTLRMYFIRRTNVLVDPDECGQVDSIATDVFTMSNVPTDWAVGSVLNAIDAEPGFGTTARSLTISNIAGSDVTLSPYANVAETNWLALNGYSPIPQVPVEAHELLVQGTALEILKSLGNTEGYKKLMVEYKEMTGFVMDSITPRADGNPKKAISGGKGIAEWVGVRWRG